LQNASAANRSDPELRLHPLLLRTEMPRIGTATMTPGIEVNIFPAAANEDDDDDDDDDDAAMEL